MCFFDQYQFECGDYKWGPFRQHCAKEYRTGETCGMKLVMATYSAPGGGKCKLCTKLETKYNRKRKEEDRIRRWEREGGRKASIEQAKQTIYDLEDEINRLLWERQQKAQSLV